MHTLGKIFKKGRTEICRRQPLKNLKWHGLFNPLSTITALMQKPVNLFAQ